MMAEAPLLAADYRGETVEGRRWRRAAKVTILNPYMGVPTVAIDEEQITSIEGQVSAKPTDVLTTTVDLTSVIPLRDPDTGALLGRSVTHGEAYVMLYSLYRQLGEARDAVNP